MDKVSGMFKFDSSPMPVFLDLGCGTGNILSKMNNAGFPGRIYGIDGSQSMLGLAKKKIRSEKKGLIQGNIDNGIPLADSSVDGIAMVNVLYATKTPPEVIRECHRVLKFDGILVIANPRPGAKITSIVGLKDIVYNPCFWVVACINVIIKILSRKEFHFTDSETLCKLLNDNGFRVMNSESAYCDTDVLTVARKVISFNTQLGQITAEVARLDEDLSEMRCLRFEVYCNEMKSLSASDFPSGEESDAYDEYSVPIVLKLGQEIIGLIRLVKDSCLGFVLDKAFELPSWLDRSKIREYSRAIIKKQYRKGRIYKVLLLSAKQWQLEHGYPISISAANTEKVSKILESEGWQYIGEPKPYHNTISVLMACYHCPKKHKCRILYSQFNS